MATIGIFTKDNEVYSGTIQTIALAALRVTFEPISRRGDKSPDYRIVSGLFDLGAAWKKTSREGAEYVSVSLDDPSFAAPIQCSLVKSGIEHGYKLIWERQRRRD